MADKLFDEFQAKRKCYQEANGHYIPKLDYIKRKAHGNSQDYGAMIEYGSTDNLYKVALARCGAMPNGSNWYNGH